MPSKTTNTLKTKGKAKPCEVCGLFNHTSEFCKYRKQNQFNKKIEQLAEGKQIKKDFEKTFFPSKQQPNKTFSKKKTIKSQHQSLSQKQNFSSEVRPKPSAVSQTGEVNKLIQMVKLLMTKVDGEPKKVSTIAPKSKSMAKMTWSPKNGPKQTATIPVLKSKPKAKIAWVLKN